MAQPDTALTSSARGGSQSAAFIPLETPDDLPCRVCDHGGLICPCRDCYISSRLQHRDLLAILAAEDKARQAAS